jgi:oligopeptide/dipeptide ABC transporter ATP-binding protein
VPLLEIDRLKIDFVADEGDAVWRAVDEVSLTIAAGETVGLVGESGCGKSVTALSIARLLPAPPARYAGGEIRLNGRNVLAMSAAELRGIRGAVVSYIFQEPGASLNPVMRVGSQIKEALRLHRARREPPSSDPARSPNPDAPGRKPALRLDAEVIRLLQQVGIPAPELRARDYPFQLSGGMQQRVMIAMALACRPQLLVADEPTTALDVTIQAQILELLRDLKQQLGMAILLITHNLGIVGQLADRVAVMYAGHIVEVAPARDLLRQPRHPYTKALLAAVPGLDASRRGEAADGPPPGPGGAGRARRLAAIPGSVPRIGELPAGCRFAPRCAIARPECSQAVPDLVEIAPGRLVRCPFGS